MKEKITFSPDRHCASVLLRTTWSICILNLTPGDDILYSEAVNQMTGPLESLNFCNFEL
ncbi:hypothetical protein JXQ70_09495 [bacterium]|nr:hypothetical protein [bacterium]